MILADIIQRVQSQYSKGVQSDDSRLTSRHIYNALITARSLILTQKINKKQKISAWTYQTIPYIEVIEIDRESSPCITSSGCKVKRSKYPLPKPLVSLNKHAIEYIRTLDNITQFYETDRFEMSHLKGNKYTAQGNRYLIDDDNYLYLFGKFVPLAVKMRIIAENPLEIFYYKGCEQQDGNECLSPFDMEFPLDADTTKTIIDITIQELVTQFNQEKEDIKNDSTDS